jgi:hypothetical protein
MSRAITHLKPLDGATEPSFRLEVKRLGTADGWGRRRAMPTETDCDMGEYDGLVQWDSLLLIFVNLYRVNSRINGCDVPAGLDPASS